MTKGYLTLVLHAHLPYVRHPEFEEFMEERWLFEAMTETYIPLLRGFEALETDGVPFHLTMSLTPPLMEMLEAKDLQEKYIRHLEKLIELAQKEVEQTRAEHPTKHKMAQYYLKDFQEKLTYFRDRVGCRLLESFKRFQDNGSLEIITCNATHGFLPLMSRYPQAVKAQISQGVKTYEKYLGRKPSGIWLAECGYVKGIEKPLADEGLSYFFVDSHGLWYAENPPRYGVYRPVLTESGVFVFGRDPESSEQVWSGEIGYPGDFRYREFYRDVGYDRELEYIASYIDRSGARVNTGIKYHRVTGKNVDLGKKDYYDVEEAHRVAYEHAKDFIAKKSAQAEALYDQFAGVQPIIVAPFDAELFGHWWFEGPKFIENLFRCMNETEVIAPISPKDFIDDVLTCVQITTPADSTWGANGYNEVWLNGSNDWIYPHLDEMAERMTRLANDFYNEVDPVKIRALRQAMRELLLAQSSDWAFIMSTGTTVEYAVNRTKQHIFRFNQLYEALYKGEIDEACLGYYEWIDGIFSDPDYRLYALR